MYHCLLHQAGLFRAIHSLQGLKERENVIHGKGMFRTGEALCYLIHISDSFTENILACFIPCVCSPTWSQLPPGSVSFIQACRTRNWWNRLVGEHKSMRSLVQIPRSYMKVGMLVEVCIPSVEGVEVDTSPELAGKLIEFCNIPTILSCTYFTF